MKAVFARKIVQPSGVIKEGFLLFHEGRILGITERLEHQVPVIWREQSLLCPGLIDIHTHGGVGYEAGQGSRDALKRWLDFKFSHGVTGFLVTTASLPLDSLKKTAEDVYGLIAEEMNILGLHLEGPFFSPGPSCGAQNPEHLLKQLTPEFAAFIREFSDIIHLTTVDPELEASRELVEICREEDIRVSAGHTEITHADFVCEKKRGYSGITHTFNGMSGLHHRDPGLVFTACTDTDLYTELICDGHHVIFPVIKFFLQQKGYERTVLITDTMPAAGLSAGTYSLGGKEVKVSEDGRAVNESGRLAGSTLTLEVAVRNMVREVGISLSAAIHMASLAPARFLGIDDRMGDLSCGKEANFVLLNPDFEVEETYFRGRKVYEREE